MTERCIWRKGCANDKYLGTKSLSSRGVKKENPRLETWTWELRNTKTAYNHSTTTFGFGFYIQYRRFEYTKWIIAFMVWNVNELFSLSWSVFYHLPYFEKCRVCWILTWNKQLHLLIIVDLLAKEYLFHFPIVSRNNCLCWMQGQASCVPITMTNLHWILR
jgi:hypothetical protein